MHAENGDRRGRQGLALVREKRPAWPRRRRPLRWTDDGLSDGNAGIRRWLRDPEPFEPQSAWESHPGAVVLDDMTPDRDEADSARILARFTVVRLFTLWGSDRLAGPGLQTERRVAAEHLNLLPPRDFERRSLERLTSLCRAQPTREAVMAALAPAMSAARDGHMMGAFALYRVAFELAAGRHWWEEATAAAAGIARLARMYEAHRSHRTWMWRARICSVRADRQRQAESEAARAAAELCDTEH
jgi:hypothetical protein